MWCLGQQLASWAFARAWRAPSVFRSRLPVGFSLYFCSVSDFLLCPSCASEMEEIVGLKGGFISMVLELSAVSPRQVPSIHDPP